MPLDLAVAQPADWRSLRILQIRNQRDFRPDRRRPVDADGTLERAKASTETSQLTLGKGLPAKHQDRVISEEAKRKTPPILHPLVHTHPITGRKALYFDSTTTVGIDGMDETSGSALLREVYEFATQSEFVYRHHWQVGDALLWDNGFTMHRREPFDPSARRLMKRTTIFLSRERHIVPEGGLAAVA